MGERREQVVEHDGRLPYAGPSTPRGGRAIIVAHRTALVCAVSGIFCGLVALEMLGSHLVDRSYNPRWFGWVTPVATPLALILGWVGLLRTTRGRRSGAPIAAVALVLGGWCLGSMLFRQRMHVDGDRAWAVQCASNLRQIGTAMMIYATRHGGQYPDSFATLLRNSELRVPVFVCPKTDHWPTRATAPDLEAKLSGPPHCSYVYVGDGLTYPTTRDAVLAYEPPSNHSGNHLNVLFGDGRVELLMASEEAVITSQAAKRARPVWYPATQPTTQPTIGAE